MHNLRPIGCFESAFYCLLKFRLNTSFASNEVFLLQIQCDSFSYDLALSYPGTVAEFIQPIKGVDVIGSPLDAVDVRLPYRLGWSPVRRTGSLEKASTVTSSAGMGMSGPLLEEPDNSCLRPIFERPPKSSSSSSSLLIPAGAILVAAVW